MNPALGRSITDTQALRALAHARRYQMFEHLQRSGPATATECAAVVGLSPSACSYHLRVLAKYGFVEQDEDRGDSRERVWRAVVTAWQSAPDTGSREAAAVDATLGRVMQAASERNVFAWLDSAAQAPAEWRDAALFSNSTIVATPDELAGIGAALMAVLAPYFQTRRPLEDAPEGARQVHAALRLMPRTP
jgi:DNA-binding transcriptional ArsR family regulator